MLHIWTVTNKYIYLGDLNSNKRITISTLLLLCNNSANQAVIIILNFDFLFQLGVQGAEATDFMVSGLLMN